MTDPDDESARLVHELRTLDEHQSALEQWPWRSALQLKKRQVLFEKLMRLWRPQLWSFVRRRSLDPAMAEDVLQIVLQRAWEHNWSSLVEPLHFFFRIGANSCVDVYRQHAKVALVEDIRLFTNRSTAPDEDPDLQADVQKILELARTTKPDLYEFFLEVAGQKSLRQYAKDTKQNHQTLSQRRSRWLLKHAHRLRDYFAR